MSDTSRAAERVRLAAIRRMAPAERMRHALALSEFVRRLALTGLKRRLPGRSDLELVELMVGNTLVPDSARSPRP